MKRRSAKPEDYPLLTAVWRKSVRQTHNFLKEADFNQIESELPSYFEQMDVQLWQEQNQLLGFSGVLDKKIEMLFLDPAFIGKGYGKQIIHTLIQEDDCQYVDVNEQNTAARAFYQAVGFVEIGRSETDDAGRPYPILHLRKGSDT
ncbi:GNAT family N-acetyltransferase [Enterococcus sp. UD-01]|jgi:putative acetyltransferase|uniref:GNAT family N-acetyltransferase n=1 Tax=Enterococcus sp. UD-01 TaxID=3373911 RepID=UPI003835B662